jgi:thymidylate synthase ThyX
MHVKSLKSSLVNGVRVDTLKIRFPRIILAELNTHRVFSRNYQSSRAKPIEKVIQEDLTYSPTYYGWRKASKGMSPTEFFDEKDSYELGSIWHESKCRAIETAKQLSEAGVAKEIVNRILEPYMEITGS